MYNVVFPTNFSTTNKKVVIEFINQFTPSLNVEVKYYVVHAYKTPKVGQHIMIDMDESLEHNAEEDMERYIKEIKKYIAKDIELIPFIRQGSFESVLHKLDREIPINLLCLIETKESAFMEVLSEKNLSTLSNSLGEPILFIPTNPNYIIPEKITFATDLKPFDNDEDFRNFLGFVKNAKAKLEFLHIAENEGDHYSVFHDIFGETLAQYELDHVPFIIINDKEVNKSIINFIETENPEMLALVERGEAFYQKWFITQTVDVLSKYASLPLFVINENKDKTQRKSKK